MTRRYQQLANARLLSVLEHVGKQMPTREDARVLEPFAAIRNERCTGFSTMDTLLPLARILQERKEEARLLPGVFRTDEPVFNMPRLGKNHVRASQDRELVGIRPDGCRVYLWHPWEKAIAPAEPRLHTDFPIRAYLQRMADLGEDPGDYESIWHYH
jgi:lysine 2,3-aminomutase